MSDVNKVVDKGNTFDMGDDKGKMIPEESNYNDFNGDSGDGAPFWLRLRIYFHLGRRWWPTRGCCPYRRYYILASLI